MMPKAKLAERIFTRAAGGYFTALLLILVLCEGAFQGYYRSGSLLSNAVLLLIAFAVGAGLLWLSRACRRPSGARFEKRLWLYFAALLAVQCVIARSIYFYPAWDIESVYCNAQLLAEGGAVEQSYFQLCGNNAPISMLLAAPLWLAGKLGLAVPYAVLPYLGALAINAACFVGMLCVCRLTDHFATRLFALIVETLWIALTMMMTIPYTDTFYVLFPMLALYVYLGKRRGLGRWLLISLWCGLGAALKPTVMIVWIAIVLTEAFSRLPWHRLNRMQWKRAACVAAVMVLGLIPGKLLEKASLQVMADSTSADGQLGWAHYLMLGMNGETYGGHSPADVTFTTSFATASEKTSANVSKALERVQSRSFAKNVRFLAVKAFKAFDDGTFAMPRSFLMKEDVKRSDGLSAFLREIYRSRGSLNGAFSTLEQGIWLLLLLMLSAGMLLGRANRASAVVSLTLLGLAAYLLLFEAWPRYLFVYAPMFVAAAANAFTIGRQPKA